MQIVGRKVEFFRCHYDPTIGITPLKAYHAEKHQLEIEVMEHGIYVKDPKGQESVVPWSNIEMYRLKAAEKPIKTTKNV